MPARAAGRREIPPFRRRQGQVYALAAGAGICHAEGMKRFIFLAGATLALMLSTAAAQAQSGPAGTDGAPMTGAQFEAYTTGKTLYYSRLGQEYGAEQYLPDHRVYWSLLDGDCKTGRWYEAGDLICFTYEDAPEAQCWAFFQTGDGLRAFFRNDPGESPLYETRQSDRPLLCLGPKVGA